ncbi:MAG: xanthine dehydrogenase family protein molybdopterin-binding subunit [Acidimicrobiia bacterium]|nr:xanthine dehydrogenase family protein molybdopterin-binding subunit [Acidimicrobiia bacterium]
MRPPLVGQRVPRVNDHGPLHGTGRYVDDIELPDMVHAAIVRSPVAHGQLTSFDAGVQGAGVTVLGPDQLRSHIRGDLPVLWTLGDQQQHATPVVDEHLRYVGQPVGVVIADSCYLAEDAIEAVELGIDELDPVVGLAEATAADSPLLYPELGSNVLATFEAGDTEAHTDAVFAGADRVFHTTLRIGRVHGLAIEARGIVAVPEPRGKLTIYTSTQTPHAVRDSVCEVLGLAQSAVRVIAPDVGGGFGLKDHIYEDEVMVAIAALERGRPVKWIEDRFESLLATTHARDEMHEVDVAVDDDGTLKGLRVRARRNVGARLAVFGGGPLFTALGVAPGPYRWEAVQCVGQLVATNTMSTGAYRGFGQTQAAFIRERAVDLVAAELGHDPVELRARNMIAPDELPYQMRTMIQFDNGDYEAALRRASALISEGPPPPDDGRARGVGYCSYVQMAGIGPSTLNELIGLSIGGFESATVRVEPDGSVRVATGVSPHGQGLETTIPQLVADELGVDLETIELIHGDTDTTPYSAYGTAASRSLAVGGGATVVATQRLADKIKTVAAEMLEASAADIELSDDRAKVVGTDVGVTIGEVARRAWQGFRLPEGTEPGLVASYSYDPLSATFSYATHACRVAVDTGTGEVRVEDYVVVHDCGKIVNPTIVEGQIHGGVAQGLGAALMEEVFYDDQGQPLSSTMLDYHVPASASMPDIRIEHMEIPSPFTPGGMKGMGEGGTNGAYAAVVNAVCAALPGVDWTELTTPLSPSRIWEAFHGQS